MGWQDTVMESYQIEVLLGRKMPISPNVAFPISYKELLKLLRTQARISLDINRREVVERVEGQIQLKRDSVFAESAFGSREHKLQAQSMVNAYDVVLGLIDKEEK